MKILIIGKFFFDGYCEGMMVRYVLALFFSWSLYADASGISSGTITLQDSVPVHFEQKIVTGEPMIPLWQEQLGVRCALGGFIVHQVTPTLEEGKVMLDCTVQPIRTGRLYFLPPALWTIQGNGELQEYSLQPFSMMCDRAYPPPTFPELFVPQGVLYRKVNAENQKCEARIAAEREAEMFHYQVVKQRYINGALLFFVVLVLGTIGALLVHEGVVTWPNKRKKLKPFDFQEQLTKIITKSGTPREKMHQGFIAFKQMLRPYMERECDAMTTRELIDCVEGSLLKEEQKRMILAVCYTFAEQLYCAREITEEELLHHFHLLRLLPLRHEEAWSLTP